MHHFLRVHDPFNAKKLFAVLLWQVKVLFFAKSRELVDCSEASVQMPAQLSGRDVHSRIIALYPRYAVDWFVFIYVF